MSGRPLRSHAYALRRCGAVLCSLALLLPGAAHALGTELPYDSFATDDAVVDVIRCGRWSAPEGDGYFRIVHGERYAQSFLYVQWMVPSPLQGDVRAMHTLSIAELNNDHAEVSLDRLRCTAQPGGIAIQARAHLGHEDKVKSLRIDVGAQPPGYRFRLR